MNEKLVSTAVSDFVLACCSVISAVIAYKSSVFAAWGLCFVGVAASFGTLRFGVVFPPQQSTVIRLHVLFTWLASVVGLPFIAAGFCIYHQKLTNANFHLVSSLIAFSLSLIHPPMENIVTQAVSSVAVFGIIFVTFTSINFYATAGALAYGAATAVKLFNSFLGFHGVDCFHYILAVGNLLLMYGLIE